MAKTLDHYYEAFVPGQTIVIAFDDKTAAHREPERIDEMFVKLRAVAGEFGFDVQSWGSPEDMARFYNRAFRNAEG